MFLSLIFIGLSGFYLKGPPESPDEVFSLSMIAGTFLLFVCFAMGMWGWGRLLVHVLRLGPSHGEVQTTGVEWALGHVFASTVAWTAMHGVGVSFGATPFFVGMVVLGWCAGIWGVGRNRDPFLVLEWRRLISLPWLEQMAWCLLAWVVITRVATAALGHGTTDPFIYHLYSPRVWVDHGHAFASLAVPHTLQASYWEYIFVWSHSVLGAPEGRGLIAAHLFGQWTHVMFGFMASALVLTQWARTIGLRGWWIPASAIIGIGSLEMLGYTWLAKNDWGVFSAFLAGTWLMLESDGTWRKAVVGSLLVGYSLASKLTLYNNVIPFYLAWFFFEWKRRRFRRGLVVASIGGLAVLPLFIRNWMYVKNPVFPLFNHWFRSTALSETWTSELTVQHGVWHGDISTWAPRLWQVLADHPANVGLPLCLAFCIRSKNSSQAAVLLATALSAAMLYATTVFMFGFLRWTGPALLLLPFLSTVGFWYLWGELEGKWAEVKALEWLAISLILLGGTIHATRQFNVAQFTDTMVGGFTPDRIVRSAQVHTAGDSKAWLRRNASQLNGELIVSTGDNQLYYVSYLPILVGRDHPTVDAAMNRTQADVDLVRELRRFGARYLLDSEHFSGGPWGVLPARLQRVYRRYPESIVFQGAASVVVDLKVLEGLIFSSCFEKERELSFWVDWERSS